MSQTESSDTGLIRNPREPALAEDTLDDAEEIERLENAEISSPEQTSRHYETFCSFKSFLAAKEILSGTFLDHSWMLNDTKNTAKGRKLWYKCRHKECPVKINLLIGYYDEKEVSMCTTQGLYLVSIN